MAGQPPPRPAPIELSERHVVEIARLYGRCADYFLLQDGVSPTIADAHDLFTDVPPEKEPGDQTVLGWQDDDGLYGLAAVLRDYPRARTWYLGFMIVAAGRRHRGVGTEIYAAVEDWAVARGGGRDPIGRAGSQPSRRAVLAIARLP